MHTASTIPEIKADLADDKDGTLERLKESIKAFQCRYHEADSDTVMFDKSRGWVFHSLAHRSIWPKAKMIVTIRDLRNVYASVEKQHRKNAFLDDATTPYQKTLEGRAAALFARQGMIGNPLVGIQDIINRKLDKGYAFIWKYEDFIEDPSGEMERLYTFLGEEPFEHEFSGIANTAKDPDWMYMYKFPHDGSGKVEKTPDNAWQRQFNGNFASQIVNGYMWFFERFGYIKAAPRAREAPQPAQRVIA